MALSTIERASVTASGSGGSIARVDYTISPLRTSIRRISTDVRVAEGGIHTAWIEKAGGTLTPVGG
jgi:hypothetical protein